MSNKIYNNRRISATTRNLRQIKCKASYFFIHNICLAAAYAHLNIAMSRLATSSTPLPTATPRILTTVTSSSRRSDYSTAVACTTTRQSAVGLCYTQPKTHLLALYWRTRCHCSKSIHLSLQLTQGPNVKGLVMLVSPSTHNRRLARSRSVVP